MLRRLSLLAVVVLASFGTIHAQGSDPQGAAAAFVPAVQGVAASDLCQYPNCLFITAGAGVDIAGSAPRINVRQVADCPISGAPQPRFEYDVQMVTPEGSVQTLGTFREYCSPPNFSSSFRFIKVATDPFNGALYWDIEITNKSITSQISRRTQELRITGLPALAELMLSYEPGGGSLSWRTPGRPLGLPSADRFQVYTGALGHAPLFQDAQPIDCSVPASGHPAVGDFIAIPDPLPDPAVGEGRYVVVAVEQGSEHRFGRQRIGGVTSGRDPADFPACQ
jgi:hypothetical protein